MPAPGCSIIRGEGGKKGRQAKELLVRDGVALRGRRTAVGRRNAVATALVAVEALDVVVVTVDVEAAHALDVVVAVLFVFADRRGPGGT